jgi:hypothetical protein
MIFEVENSMCYELLTNDFFPDYVKVIDSLCVDLKKHWNSGLWFEKKYKKNILFLMMEFLF